MSVLLIHPPVSKPCEPPPGLARLAGAFMAAGIDARLWDANLEGLQNLISQAPPAQDTWTRRALKNRTAHLAALRDPQTFLSFDRYSRAVRDINRLLAAAGTACGAELSLADYRDADLSPVCSTDLVRSAAEPQRNPFYGHFSTRLRQLLAEDEPSLIGLSVNFLSQALTAWAMMGFLRQEGGRSRIALGGGLITSWLRRPAGLKAADGLADHLIAGPGEQQLLELAGSRLPAADAPLPLYAGLPLDGYLAPARVIPFSTASGCYWKKCAFCPEQSEATPYRPVSAVTATAQLRQLVDMYRPGLLHLVDNALSPAFLRQMTTSPPGAHWYGFARVTPGLQDEDFCRGLQESGCVMLQLGLESGDDDVLAALSKGVTVADASRALKNLKKAGIGTYVYLLFGTPAETQESARRTLEFTIAHSAHIDFLNLAIFNMPVNAADAGQHTTGPFYEGDLALYTAFDHPQGWGRAEVRRFLDREFKRHPAIAPILRRDPPLFTSSHAPFFLRAG